MMLINNSLNKKQKNKPLTYVSLFSSAGVGCFGFQQNGFECIATNELLDKRIKFQKNNDKCKYPSGYICADITADATKEQIKNEIKFWKIEHGIDTPDVLIATPPCQGMSVANHKKSIDEIKRNSLVIESIKIIRDILPKIFIFENVAAFLKTACVDDDGSVLSISDAISKHLSNKYTVSSQVMNFKNYGSNSSRTRSLVIGVNKKYANEFTPEELFPVYKKEKTLKEVIGHLPSLNIMGEVNVDDFFHAFRKYDERMRPWIKDIKEGQSAFDNQDMDKKPHQIVNGRIVVNQMKNGDKYTRQSWNKVAPCIHTRNDQLASQNTVHPNDDRVFSIRELMLIMSIPKKFKWIKDDIKILNQLSLEEKSALYKKEEMSIRQSIGEAVPTGVFTSIAKNIKKALNGISLTEKEVIDLISKEELNIHNNLMQFLKKKQSNYTLRTLSMIAEYANAKREQNAAYYTDKMLIRNIAMMLPNFYDRNELHILEPSVGVGSFLPLVIKKYSHIDKVVIDCVDISEESIEILQFLISLYDFGDNLQVNFIANDFLKLQINKKYDLVVGNPPFGKFNTCKAEMTKDYYNYASRNISSYFIEKCVQHSDNVVMVMPKNLLNSSDFDLTRKYLSRYNINEIMDFGEYGFKGVLVETICISIDTTQLSNKTKITSLPLGVSKLQLQAYITSDEFPYWIIYRNDYFDSFISKLELNVFEVFRDRQLTNSSISSDNQNKIRVLKSRNITDDGKIIDIDGYDAYIDKSALNRFSVSKYLNENNVYLTPNMTYKIRLMKKPKETVTNGSVAILIPKFKGNLSKDDLNFFSSNEYREYMRIARNYQTRTLNVDNNSVYFYGIKRAE